MGETYDAYDAKNRGSMVRILLEDPLFKTLHSMVSGPELFRTYIKNAQKNPDNPQGVIDYAFYNRLDTAQQLLNLEIKRGTIPHHPTDADYQPDFFNREYDPGSDLIREGNLDQRLTQSK